MIEGNKSDVWMRGTMLKQVENMCKKNKSNGWKWLAAERDTGLR
jgi:hypothetical protein